MSGRSVISVVGCHAGGEVGNVVVGGVLPPPGVTVFEQMQALRADDSLRMPRLHEPRGSVAVHANLVVPSQRDDCDAGSSSWNRPSTRDVRLEHDLPRDGAARDGDGRDARARDDPAARGSRRCRRGDGALCEREVRERRADERAGLRRPARRRAGRCTYSAAASLPRTIVRSSSTQSSSSGSRDHAPARQSLLQLSELLERDRFQQLEPRTTAGRGVVSRSAERCRRRLRRQRRSTTTPSGWGQLNLVGRISFRRSPPDAHAAAGSAAASRPDRGGSRREKRARSCRPGRRAA